MQQSESKSTPRINRTIVVDFIQAKYELNIHDTCYVRSVLNSFIDRHPELFPYGIQHGYQMNLTADEKYTKIVTVHTGCCRCKAAGMQTYSCTSNARQRSRCSTL